MIDGCGREIDHLRLSLTDTCNLACRYCVPQNTAPHERMIDARFACSLVRWLSKRHGIRHLRLTGGEPLLYPELIPLIEGITASAALDEITLTTNAQALAQQARRLRAAGLARLNVSLDTLDPDRFSELTRGGRLIHTLRGIEAAVAEDLSPVKINVVTQRGLNHDELPDIAAWGLSRGCIVRFLEVMPIGPLAHLYDQHLVPAPEILERLSRRFELRTIPSSLGQPATNYAATCGSLRGVIGIIAATTRPFCSVCRRLRVTSKGELIPCVHDRNKAGLLPAWNGRKLDEDLADSILEAAVAAKPAEGPRNQAVTMLSLGG
jgi:cyclic pyranopterin phosphate synthase